MVRYRITRCPIGRPATAELTDLLPTAAPVPAGLLYYSQLNTIILVDARPNEVRALIMARNEVAEWLARDRVSLPSVGDEQDIQAPFMPPTVDNPKECDKCYAGESCMLYRKVSLVPRVPADAGRLWTRCRRRRMTPSPGCTRPRPGT